MEVRQGCHKSETHHNSSNLNNFGIRIHTKVVQNIRLHCIKVENRPLVHSNCKQKIKSELIKN